MNGPMKGVYIEITQPVDRAIKSEGWELTLDIKQGSIFKADIDKDARARFQIMEAKSRVSLFWVWLEYYEYKLVNEDGTAEAEKEADSE